MNRRKRRKIFREIRSSALSLSLPRGQSDAASPVDRKARNIRWFLRRGQHCDRAGRVRMHARQRDKSRDEKGNPREG